MSLRRLLNTTATASRLTAGVGIQKTYVAGASYPTIIQPISARLGDRGRVEDNMAMGVSHYAYFEITADIRVSDQLVSGGVTYSVTGIRKRNYGSFPHLAAYLVEEPGK